MRVISPRRSSTSAAGSGSLYGTTSASGAGSSGSSSGIGTSSSLSGGSSSSNATNGYSRYSSSSYFDLPKLLPTSRTSSLSSSGSNAASSGAYNHYNSGSSSSSSHHYPSAYSSTYSSYNPRASTTATTQRSSIGSTSYLSGGSGSLGNSGYRTNSSYLSGSSYDTSSFSRYGTSRRSKGSTPIGDGRTSAGASITSKGTASTKKDDYATSTSTLRRDAAAAKKLPPSGSNSNSSNNDATNGNSSSSSKRLSSSCSSSSLARLVATSGLDIYEKYSPANYKPNCELSRSRSAINESDTTDNNNNNNNSSSSSISKSNSNDNNTSCTVTLDRPRSSRYSRLYSSSSDAGDAAETNSTTTSSNLRGRSGSGRFTLSSSNSSGDVPTATFTLRSNRTRARNTTEKDAAATTTTTTTTTNGHATESCNSNGLDAKLNGLSLLSTSPKRNAIYDSSSSSTITTPATTTDTTDDAAAATHVDNVSATNGSASLNGDADGDVCATATLTLGESASARSKASRNVSSSSRSVLPPVSPTSSRYWDRDSTRSNSNATSSSIGTSSLSTKHNSSVDDGYKSSRDEKFEGTCGLRNIGNTCFMSSVIQCLSHTTELTRFLRQYHTSARSTRSTSKDEQILYEFAKLIQEMWTTNVNSVTPMGLKLAFSTKHRMYSDCSQQDAQEFLRFFLDSLHSALNTGTKGEPLNIDDNLSDNKKADLTWEWYSRNENSLIRDLFVGQLKSTLKCTSCSNTSVTFDPFWDLSVPLPSSSRCKLDACLDLFIREEVLDGDEMPTCSKCKTRRKCTKSLTIQRFPKYLVIHLKRFSETRWSKLSNMVEFPTGDRELNMASYGANPNSNVHYSLYAISNHMGSTVGGHYVAICKHPDSHKWHEFNDNIVSDALSESCLVSPSAYILFYERA
ncbi:ubiquitin carboxyl-terminal hydrolase Usp2 isoform X2 [Drosophila nasuta]|uniref:ubiquitin carboxyl-terminal hydrolase Usp2 isoform X2 n=1 Tax=Drosophila nasuta TaxID=42062 RepID=UPI00295E226B|nr:ubiquitin carboxyl-terminal hydrolase Usp2 isoform X2 [Drosophila nasuta]XP_060665104.1 ubiquitin carboxyl-terminal hydrolase Usp2 isoform X2 [Drosophila nasuta]XP_060665105.1 ubiquitin carboxyl-terminal hydrolase Usp2 isoform X2 [Drosophila nasuta]